LRGGAHDVHDQHVEPVVDREEAVATLFAIADLNANVERILRLLEGESDGDEGLSEEDA
jgi:hypothetical protein